MIEVIHVELKANKTRIGTVAVRYYGLIICCELCLYKNQNLWIRMPEMWTSKVNKRRMTYWEDKQISDQMQVLMLKQVADKTALTLEQAIEMKYHYFCRTKELTTDKNKLTLNEKTTET